MDKNINNPHDKFFRHLVSSKETAIDFLKTFLPEKVTKLIDFSSLKYEQESYIDKSLREAFSDVIFKFRLLIDVDSYVFISILVEHKSYPDKYTPVQILKYLANGYEKQLKTDKKLTLILPFIYYHGKENWKYMQLGELIEFLPENLQGYAPYFDTVFVDLNRMSDKELKGLNNLFLATTLLMQKYSYDSHLVFIKFIETIKDTDDTEFIEGNLFGDLLVTIFRISQVDDKILEKALLELPANTKSKIMTLYQTIEQKGIQKGIEKGIQKGIEKGIQKGIEKGIQKGIEKGAWQKNIEFIVNGYNKGLSIDFLADITKLDIEQVKEIIANHKDELN